MTFDVSSGSARSDHVLYSPLPDGELAAEMSRRAALTVAVHAHDAAELGELLAMLGLDGNPAS